MSSDLVEVHDLKVYYMTAAGAARAVDGVSLVITRGEIVGIVGESGCGKSTLAAGILRLVRPPCYVKGGRVLFDGVDLMSLGHEEIRKMRLKRFSWIPQGSMNSLNPIKRIRDQIRDGILAHEESSHTDVSKRIRELIEMVGLPPETAMMYPHELSGGMRQRAVIAIALCLQPQFVVADEPTTALDVVVQRAVLQFITGIKDDFGSSVMLITHDMAVTAETCDRLAVMYAGKLVEVGRVEDVFKEPLHPYTKALIEATPSLLGKRKLRMLSGFPPSLVNPMPGCRFRERCPEYNCQKCGDEEPSLHEVGSNRMVACHLWWGK